jgi:chromosome segregation protein
MRVEKIELIGFKSFSEKTAFSLHPGITCIVGPNGCGKSNVVDSFKWVLGEQSAKSLRGGKMEEVIFAGSQSRKPKGMAEVMLTVSGLGSSGNGDSLTTVTRRLYRSGESDYLLNRTACRLKDIKDLFLDTGLEMKSYSMLEQDRIGALLTAKPEERRFLIEEVAGVVKYKVRRHEARNKLENSRTNLQRIGDIVAEVKRQINSLDRQVKKAERYKRLLEELRGIELRIARRDWAQLTGALEGVLGEYDALREETALRRGELSEREAALETGRIELTEKEKALDGLRRELQGLEREMAEAERVRAVLGAEREHIEQNIVRLRTEQGENAGRQEAARAGLSENRTRREALRGEMEGLSQDLERQEAALRAAEEEAAGKEHVLETSRRDLFKVSDELSAARNDRHRLETERQGIAGRGEELDREGEEMKAARAQAEAALGETEAAMKEKNAALLALREEKETLSEEIERSREDLEALRAEVSRSREEMASMVSRLESLREMALGEGEELRDDLTPVALVSDILEAPPEYERAVESALREAVGGFIVPDLDALARAVSTVKEKNAARTAFVPLALEGLPGEAPLPEGVLARGADVVSTGEEYAGLLRALLGRVFIVPDLETALRVGPREELVVTLEGEAVEPTGAVVAGRSRGLLALKRQLRELAQDVEGARERVRGLEAETARKTEALKGLEDELYALGERVYETERELSLLRREAERGAEEQARLNRKISHLAIEVQELHREGEALGEALRKKDEEIQALEAKRAGAEQRMEEFSRSIAELRAAHEEKRKEAVELRLTLGSLKERDRALQSEGEATGRLIEELTAKDAQIAREITSLGERMAEREREEARREEALRSLAARAHDMEATISRKQEALALRGEELASLERALKGLREGIAERAERLSELEVRRTELALKRENLAENMKNAWDVDLSQLEDQPVTEEDEERLPEVRKKMEAIGPVSLGSIEEYEELKQRYEFLTRQQEDLVRSIAELEEAISRINTTTRRKLREAYEALKEKFAEVFVTLFGGGQAELVLTDPGNILETGLDVVAQPPGKKLQNISLLSGGEKSLAALALLFASFLIKPTPLCVLDEADASLDESNTHKFAQMLKEISRDIQFIVVTHNRVTMEVADYIYGVTMEEPGSSKVISLEMSPA